MTLIRETVKNVSEGAICMRNVLYRKLKYIYIINIHNNLTVL